jgi:hypothetical protein
MTKEQATAYCRTVQGHPSSCQVCHKSYPNGVPEIPVRKRNGSWKPLAVCTSWCLEDWQKEYGWQE